MIKITQDLYPEHERHTTYNGGCSTCWTENLRVEASGRDAYLENQEALEPRNGSSPWDLDNRN